MTSGIEYELSDSFEIQFSGSTARSRLDLMQRLLNPNGSEAQLLKDKSTEELRSLDLLLTGDLMQLPAGSIAIAAGASRSWSEFNQDSIVTTPTSSSPVISHAEREISSVFGEILAPIVSSEMQIPLVNRFEVSLAGRYDEYSDFGSTFNPRFGVSWWPSADLKLSVGVSFPLNLSNVGSGGAGIDARRRVNPRRTALAFSGVAGLFTNRAATRDAFD